MAVDVQITDVQFAKLNSLSLRNGMKLQDIIDEAISDYLEKKYTGAREHVMSALKESMERYDTLYKELAK